MRLLRQTWLLARNDLRQEARQLELVLTAGFFTLVVFSAMLGLHAGLNYGMSRTAIANSLGTMFFLFVGIILCMVLILQARSSYALQLPSFLVFIVGGSLALGASHCRGRDVRLRRC